MGEEKRSDQRYVTEIPVVLRTFPRATKAFISDISEAGIFIQTEDSVLKPKQPIALEIEIAKGKRLEAIGVVAHTRKGKHGETNMSLGFGIDIIELAEDSWDEWTAFVKSISKTSKEQDRLVKNAIDKNFYPHTVLEQKIPTQPNLAANLAANDVSENISIPIFVLKPTDLSRMHRLTEVNSGVKGIFLKVVNPPKIGEKVIINIIHPLSHKEFSATAIVTKTKTDGWIGNRGMMIHFTEFDQAKRLQFRKFLSEVEPSSPSLEDLH